MNLDGWVRLIQYHSLKTRCIMTPGNTEWLSFELTWNIHHIIYWLTSTVHHKCIQLAYVVPPSLCRMVADWTASWGEVGTFCCYSALWKAPHPEQQVIGSLAQCLQGNLGFKWLSNESCILPTTIPIHVEKCRTPSTSAWHLTGNFIQSSTQITLP